jgi:hypothetical protein
VSQSRTGVNQPFGLQVLFQQFHLTRWWWQGRRLTDRR